MYSKVTIAGHPVHPMLVAYPVAGYTGTLVGYAVYGASGDQFWLNFAIAMNIAGVGGALLAALPGIADLALGVPLGSQARKVGQAHAVVNVAALALFGVTLGLYADHWDGPPRSAVAGIVLAAIGVCLTVSGGFLGWMLVQTYHVGVSLTPYQQQDEVAVQSEPALRNVRPHHHRAA
ncbi:DUF2231 domain-containing protein [Kitasatospora sp. NPDC127111]|uniref:DUF2231 domain-containing protein n=1 Tax=Kitasatospora sp. NPDC127111 TaxID=3345363 RepID=UPI00363537DE